MITKPSGLPINKALDRHLGDRLSRRRRELGMTAPDLDRALLATPGTVSKLEAGTKRMNASQLFALGKALDVPVMYFFENSPVSLSSGSGQAPKSETIKEAERFIEAYFKIDDSKVRNNILGLLKAAAEEEA